MTAHPPRVLADAGFCDRSKLPPGANGRPLCRWCQTEVDKPQKTFCGKSCIHEWRLRSNPGYAREKVWERDHGKCALCSAVCTRRNYGSGSGWEMDHTIPVAEGGGSCGLDGLRTLCIPCHKRVTAELRVRLAAQKKAIRD